MPTFAPPFDDTSRITEQPPLDRSFFRLGRRTRVTRELLDSLIGATAGSTAFLQNSRVAAGNEDEGGARPIELQTIINRATTSDDRADLRAKFLAGSQIATPQDGAGNVNKHPAWPA